MVKIIPIIKKAIDDVITLIASKKTPRNYLGASSIGEECERKLWYSYHKKKPINDPRVHRIMDLGHLIESYCLSMLKHAGFELFYEEGGEQFGFVDEEVAGHADGVIILDKVPHLLEIKSANDTRFKEMVKVGVEVSNPLYFAQMQVYMKYLELDYALYFVLNKNNSDIHMEIIKYEKIRADYYVKRGKEIIRSKEEPERKYKSAAFFKCKFCDYSDECWYGVEESSKPPKDFTSAFKLAERILLQQ